MSVSQIGIAQIPENQRMLGKGILVLTTAVLISTFVFQLLHKTETISAGFENWQPVMYAYLVWAIGLCWSQVLIRGERGKRALFVLPAFLFTIAMVIFPLLFGIYIALHDWNLSSFEGMKYNGLDNFRQLLGDPYFWNSLLNMVYYLGGHMRHLQYIPHNAGPRFFILYVQEGTYVTLDISRDANPGTFTH